MIVVQCVSEAETVFAALADHSEHQLACSLVSSATGYHMFQLQLISVWEKQFSCCIEMQLRYWTQNRVKLAWSQPGILAVLKSERHTVHACAGAGQC